MLDTPTGTQTLESHRADSPLFLNPVSVRRLRFFQPTLSESARRKSCRCRLVLQTR